MEPKRVRGVEIVDRCRARVCNTFVCQDGGDNLRTAESQYRDNESGHNVRPTDPHWFSYGQAVVDDAAGCYGGDPQMWHDTRAA